MIRRHLEGSLNAVVRRVTNARSEGLNSKIQWIWRISWGFRNTERFRNAIYFHLGGLDLHPGAR
jgi:transposase